MILQYCGLSYHLQCWHSYISNGSNPICSAFDPTPGSKEPGKADKNPNIKVLATILGNLDTV